MESPYKDIALQLRVRHMPLITVKGLEDGTHPRDYRQGPSSIRLDAIGTLAD